ncbi:MAG TPA: response regulator [Acetobacteraceae bacterium]|jgi:CheY-like chemotaxis protein
MTDAATQPTEPEPSPGRPVVLVVDDEILLRSVVAEYLRDAGFRVVEAANGREAVTVLAAGEAVDVVFSDVRMPGDVSGYDLAEWVSINRPAVHVLLTSGYVGAVSRSRHVGDSAPMLLPKPFDYERLLQQLRGLIGRPDTG